MLKSAFRNSLASLLRTLPYFRGKYRLGPLLIPLLTDYANEQDCLINIQLRDRSQMRLDLRSFTEQRAFFAGDYDGGIIQRFAAMLQPGDVVLDVGANVGFYAIALGRQLQHLGDGAKLWALEPVTSNYERLCQNVALNDLEAVVFPMRTAVGNQEGEVVLGMGSPGDLATTGNAVLVQERPMTAVASHWAAPITRLDTLTQQQQITACRFIKVDIEGAELDFLRGGSRFINQCRPIIYGEFNPHWCREFGYSFIEVAELVLPWGYNLYQQSKNHKFIPVQTVTSELTDVLLVPQETDASTLQKLGVIS